MLDPKGFFAVFFSLLILTGPLYAEFPLPPGTEDFHEKRVYEFNQYLRHAETWSLDSRMQYLKGHWKENSYEFKELGPRAKIQEIVVTVEGVEREGIRFNPIKGVKRYLRYLHVKPGSRLFLAYGVEVVGSPEKISYLDFRILAGSHVLRHIRVPVRPGWVTEEIPLGVIGFWNREIPVTFEMFTDSDERSFFSFQAEILK